MTIITASRRRIEGIKHMTDNVGTIIPQETFVFNDILKLDKRGVQRLYYIHPDDNQDTGHRYMPDALKGATNEVQNHVFKSISKVSEKMLRDDIDYVKPSDIEIKEAQQKIADLAIELLNGGKITVKST